MIPIRYTRNSFLRAMCVVYLFAFISFYIQIPGLYGNNGILPVKSLLENSKHKTFSAKVHYQPTLLWLAPYLGLDTQYALDVLSLLGSFLAFTGFVSQKICTIPLFAGLWSLYFSLYQVGQVFVTSQWDDLLLEAGFLCLLVAPLLPSRRNGSRISPKDNISFWLVKWLLFRFLVTSGIVKFISGCPKWWDLSALTYHFQSSVLPTPLSWYAHHLPVWILRLSAVFTNVSGILLPFLFFVPIRGIRITSFAIQIFLQIFIVLTGNYNFVNMLVVTLLISLLDDSFFFGKTKKSDGVFRSVLSIVALLIIPLCVIALVSVLYTFTLTNDMEVNAKIAFSKDQFNNAIKNMVAPTIIIGITSLSLTSLRAMVNTIRSDKAGFSKFLGMVSTLFYSIMAIVIFAGSTVPLQSLHKSTNYTINHPLRTVYNRLGKLHALNSYGNLFTKMTGVDGGRLEIILEGAASIEGPWSELNFMYKPGNVNHSLPFVAPYSPRLDWQLWWAAQSTYDKQPWLLSLAHRILTGKTEVLALLDHSHSRNSPPKYLRAQLYRYQFTEWSQRETQTWWRRTLISEYMPAYARDSPALVDYLSARNLLPAVTPSASTSSRGAGAVDDLTAQLLPWWRKALDPIRSLTGYLEATLLLWSVFTAGCAIITTTSGGGSKSGRRN